MSSISERALVFLVDGSPVLGILHSPARPPRTGIVMFAAGGPQYHVGCCRQLLVWARRFAANGLAVLRFDYRGMGDSGGPYQGFLKIENDLRSAIDRLEEQHPEIENIVLWGGCNAASAIMIYAWKDPRVTHLITLNPWTHTEATQARAELRYYLERLRDPAFWKKLFAGKLDVRKAFASLTAALSKLNAKPEAATQQEAPDESQPPPDGDPLDSGEDGRFVEAMRVGLERFQGEVLLLMSGQSFVGREFDQTVASSRRWRRTVAAARLTRRELPEAGHTFSTHEAQDAAFEAALTWLQSRN